MEKQPKPMKRAFSTEVDVSFLCLEPGHYVHIHAGEHSVEIVHKEDGTLQVCADGETLASGIHSFEHIYGPDPFKDEKVEE